MSYIDVDKELDRELMLNVITNKIKRSRIHLLSAKDLATDENQLVSINLINEILVEAQQSLELMKG